MAKLIGSQLSLIAEIEDDSRPISDWGYEQLGTKEVLVPNFPALKLGTEEILVPNSTEQKLGTEEILVPNFYEPPQPIRKWDEPIPDNWKPPIGCLDRKWIKSHQYWCWRYYDNRGKKTSIHLHKDYNKAVLKAMKIGVPTDAKIPNLSAANPETIGQQPTVTNLIHIAPTAHPASRAA